MYEVFIERSAERDIKRLQEGILQRIIFTIMGLSNNPRPKGCRKISGSKSDWRIRIGDYRVLYEIDDNNKSVKIMRILHRSSIYKKI